jgi:hypothetical protein
LIDGDGNDLGAGTDERAARPRIARFFEQHAIADVEKHGAEHL